MAERTDEVEEKLIARPPYCSCWDILWDNRFDPFMLRSLIKTGYNRLLGWILNDWVPLRVTRMLAALGKKELMANHGELLRHIIKHKRMREQKMKILRQHGFSQSDFASVDPSLN